MAIMRCRWCGKDVDSDTWVNGLHKECDLEARGIYSPAKVKECPECENMAIVIDAVGTCLKCANKKIVSLNPSEG